MRSIHIKYSILGLLIVPFLYFIHTNALAQNQSVSGHISDIKTGEPIPFVNVFFNNTTIGTTSDTEGNYRIAHLDSGLYTLVISMVGYETISRQIRFTGGKNQTLNFQLKESVTTLSEVEFIGKEDKQWLRNLRKFKRAFLGNKSGYIKHEFANPYVLEFYKDKKSNIFQAVANAPLEIVNHDLGYIVNFFLQHFEQKSESLIFFGQTHFEELNSDDPAMNNTWENNRLETYEGSMTHFFKALIDNNLDEEGIMAYHMSGIYPYQNTDTFFDKIGKEYQEVDPPEIITNSKYVDEKIIRFNDEILIIYTLKEWDDSPYTDISSQVSWIRLTGNSLRVHKSGFVYNPVGYELFGYRSEDRVLQMLPFEYQPDKNKSSTY